MKRIKFFILPISLSILFIMAAQGLAQHVPLQDPIPEVIQRGELSLRLETVATGLTAPNWGAPIPGCTGSTGRLAVVDQDGILWSIDLASGEKTVLLDLSGRLVSLGIGGPGTYDERGFLGAAFHPDFATNGLLYTYTSEPVSGAADFSTMSMGEEANHQAVISEWQIPDPCNPDSVVDPASWREILRIDQPQFNHNGGTVLFGPDGYLYISLGDGGSADDQGEGHVDGGNGQDPTNILGAILRIDPQGNDSANGRYGIPADNPFVMDGGLDEIWAYGFRNPFRFSFDSQTGDMYITDVGQNDIEEVNLGLAGNNYGWRYKEGSFCFDPNEGNPGFVFECAEGDVPEGLTEPIAEYDHDEGVAVVGGFVYRGDRMPDLRGYYVFGDHNNNAAGGGRLFYWRTGELIQEFQFAGQENLGLRLLGFAEGGNGELYVLANETGNAFGETGVVLRVGAQSDYTGWWWGGQEATGTGYSIEVQNVPGQDYDIAYLVWYLYDESGMNTWYSAIMQLMGNTMNGTLVEYEGWPLEGDTPEEPVVERQIGPISVTFTDVNNGTITYTADGQQYEKNIERWQIAGDNDPRNFHGWWWDVAKPGIGWFLESRDDRFFMGWYNYRAAPEGEEGDSMPRWFIMVDFENFTPGTAAVTRPLLDYSGGQTITGEYMEPAFTALNDFSLTFPAEEEPATLTATYQGITYDLTPFPIPDIFAENATMR